MQRQRNRCSFYIFLAPLNCMFWYYSDLDQKHPLWEPLPKVLENLEKRSRNNIWEPPIYEYLQETRSRMYFDLDGAPQVPEFPFILLCILQEVFRIEGSDIGGILSASSSSQSSYHVTLNFSATRSMCKCAALKLQEFLNFLGFTSIKVDPKVYGVTQKFRTIYSTKRCQNRPFLPVFHLYGHRPFRIEDTLISVIPKTPFYFTDMTLPANFTWFRKCLDTPTLNDRLRHMATSYQELEIVGRSLFVEGVKNNKIQEAEDLFVEFCQLSPNPDNEENIRTSFQKRWVNVEKSQFSKIKQWIKETGIVLPKEQKTKEKEKTNEKTIVPLYDRIPTITETCPEPSKPFNYITYQQYLIGEIITHSQPVRCYLKQFTKMNESLRLFCLVQDPEYHYYNESLELYNAFYSKTELADLPFAELPLRNSTLPFFYWLGDVFELELTPAQYVYDLTIHSNLTRSFMEIAEELDYETVHEIYVRANCRSLHYGPDEERDWKREIQQLFKYLNEPLFEMQIAYRHIWRELSKTAFNEESFWILFVYVQSRCFKADKVFHYISYITQARTAALFLYTMYPYITQIPGSRRIYFFDFRSGIWTMSEQARHSLISEFSACFSSVTPTRSQCVTARAAGIIDVEAALSTLPELQQKAAAPNVAKSRGYLLFNNGVYDGHKKRFIPNRVLSLGGVDVVIYDPSYVFMGKIFNDYRPLKDTELDELNDMETVFFTGMHGEEVGLYWKRLLGLLLFGFPYKGFVEHVGDSNCGKSTELEMIRESFGSYYIPGHTSNYEQRKMDSRPEERQLGFIVDTWFARLSGCSEKGSSGNTMQAERMKKIVSAGLDSLAASLLFQNTDTAGYIVNFVPLFYVNHPLIFDNPADPGIKTRRTTITSTKVYETVVTDKALHLLRRPEVSKWPKDAHKQLLFIHLAINGFHEAISLNWHHMNPKDFRPACLEPIEENTTSSSDDIMEQFMYYYEITGNPESRVLRQDLVNDVESNMKLIFDKAFRVFREYVGAYGVKIETARQTVKGVKYTCYTGLSARGSLIEPSPILSDLAHWKRLMQKHNGMLSKKDISILQYIRNICVADQAIVPDMDKLLEYGTDEQIGLFSLDENTSSGRKRQIDEI